MFVLSARGRREEAKVPRPLFHHPPRHRPAQTAQAADNQVRCRVGQQLPTVGLGGWDICRVIGHCDDDLTYVLPLFHEPGGFGNLLGRKGVYGLNRTDIILGSEFKELVGEAGSVASLEEAAFFFFSFFLRAGIALDLPLDGIRPFQK